MVACLPIGECLDCAAMSADEILDLGGQVAISEVPLGRSMTWNTVSRIFAEAQSRVGSEYSIGELDR